MTTSICSRSFLVWRFTPLFDLVCSFITDISAELFKTRVKSIGMLQAVFDLGVVSLKLAGKSNSIDFLSISRSQHGKSCKIFP